MSKKKVSKQAKGMVDISQKDITKRIAIASGMIRMGKQSLQSLLSGESPKGDVLETAKVAGIMAAKLTPNIIPMCHPLAIKKVSIEFDVNKKENSILITSEVICLGRTGVEMEALVAASVAALTIYDMMKWADKEMEISDIKLMYKSGGKSGIYKRV